MVQTTLSRMMTEPLVVDVREAYRRRATRERSVTVNVPLGVLLGDPTRLPNDRRILVFGNDPDESEFAARYLRQFGRDAYAVRGDEGDF